MILGKEQEGRHVSRHVVAGSSTSQLTSDDVADPTVRVDAADLFGMCRVHFHLPTEQESCRECEHTAESGVSYSKNKFTKMLEAHVLYIRTI